MTQKLHANIETTLADLDNILNGDRPTTHGDIADFAATFTELHTAYLTGMMRAQRAPNQLDSYAIQIIQKLARIANSAPEHAEPHFIDIAGYAVAGTAHTRTATAARADAQAAAPAGPSGAPSRPLGTADMKLPPLMLKMGALVPDDTLEGTPVYAERKTSGGIEYLGAWEGPDLGLQGGPAPKG